MVPLDETAKYDKKDFYANPGKYRCVFNTKYLPYISALFHCIYWEPGYPKYVENKDLYNLANNRKLRLMGVCDVFIVLLRSLAIWMAPSNAFKTILSQRNPSSTTMLLMTRILLIPLIKKEKFFILPLTFYLVN